MNGAQLDFNDPLTREKILSALPSQVLILLSEIEDFARTKVGFRDSTLLRAAGGNNTDVEALYADHNFAYISVPSLESVNFNAITHELLHLKRYWVDGIPMMDVKTDRGNNVEIVSSIDNALEHLLIVPQEARYGFNPTPHWDAEARELWLGHPWSKLDPHTARMYHLLGWITATLGKDYVLREEIREKLRSSRLLFEADNFSNRLTTFLDNKPRLVSAALRFLKIPRQQVELVYLDTRLRDACD